MVAVRWYLRYGLSYRDVEKVAGRWVSLYRAIDHHGQVIDVLVSQKREKYANNPMEADHGRVKSRLRPMRGLTRLRFARVVSAGHAFVQNIRRGHDELRTEKCSVRDGTGKPQVEMFGTPTESIIGAGGHCHDGRLTMYTHDDQPVVQLTTANPRLILGGGNRPGSVSVHGKDGAPCVELFARDNEDIRAVDSEHRRRRLVFDAR